MRGGAKVRRSSLAGRQRDSAIPIPDVLAVDAPFGRWHDHRARFITTARDTTGAAKIGDSELAISHGSGESKHKHRPSIR